MTSEVILSAFALAEQGEAISDRQWGLIRSLAENARQKWREPDSGIWEVRNGPHHFVYSRVMCWVALDRAARLAEATGRGGVESEAWRREAENIKADVLGLGWDPDRDTFVQRYGSSALDASNLLIPILGFLEPTDPRAAATVRRIRDGLGRGPLVMRYLTHEADDGVSGSEGAFTLCSFWLVQALIRIGLPGEAQTLFDELLTYANHLGLFSEMIDPETGIQLGNFPQAFTHIGLILAALDLDGLARSEARLR